MQKTSRTSTTKGKPRGRPFEKGNPGRPLGATNKRTRFLREMLDDEGASIVEAMVQLAKAGNAGALNICARYLLGSSDDRPIDVDLGLPTISSPTHGLLALRMIFEAVEQGRVGPHAANILADFVIKIIGALPKNKKDWALGEPKTATPDDLARAAREMKESLQRERPRPKATSQNPSPKASSPPSPTRHPTPGTTRAASSPSPAAATTANGNTSATNRAGRPAI